MQKSMALAFTEHVQILPDYRSQAFSLQKSFGIAKAKRRRELRLLELYHNFWWMQSIWHPTGNTIWLSWLVCLNKADLSNNKIILSHSIEIISNNQVVIKRKKHIMDDRSLPKNWVERKTLLLGIVCVCRPCSLKKWNTNHEFIKEHFTSQAQLLHLLISRWRCGHKNWHMFVRACLSRFPGQFSQFCGPNREFLGYCTGCISKIRTNS